MVIELIKTKTLLTMKCPLCHKINDVAEKEYDGILSGKYKIKDGLVGFNCGMCGRHGVIVFKDIIDKRQNNMW